MKHHAGGCQLRFYKAGGFDAIKVKVPTGFDGKFQEKSPTFLWLSDDARRLGLSGRRFLEEHFTFEMLVERTRQVGLAEVDARLVRVVEMRYFAGFTLPEVAELLGISEATVARDWRGAKAWLTHQLGHRG